MKVGPAGEMWSVERAGREVLGLVAVGDAAAVQIVGRDFDRDPVALEDADAKTPHLAGDGRQHVVAVLELDAEVAVAEDGADGASEFECFFFRDDGLLLS